MKIKSKKVISVQDWDVEVTKVYGRPYSFQQQEGCKSRGVFHLTVPAESEIDDHANDTIPEIVNGEEMCVKFSAWLARNPKQKIKDEQYDFERELWWHRNFYPDVQMVANDLNSKGLLDSGEYTIEIDW